MHSYLHGLLMLGSGFVIALAFVPPDAPLLCSVILGGPALWLLHRHLSLEERRRWRKAAELVRQRRTSPRAETG